MSIVRLWKGYRQAQVGFTARSATNKVTKSEEIIPCLVIYTSVRGSIDIWPLNRNGARIATIKVTKNGYLCYQPVAPSFRWSTPAISSTSTRGMDEEAPQQHLSLVTEPRSYPLRAIYGSPKFGVDKRVRRGAKRGCASGGGYFVIFCIYIFSSYSWNILHYFTLFYLFRSLNTS